MFSTKCFSIIRNKKNYYLRPNLIFHKMFNFSWKIRRWSIFLWRLCYWNIYTRSKSPCILCVPWVLMTYSTWNVLHLQIFWFKLIDSFLSLFSTIGHILQSLQICLSTGVLDYRSIIYSIFIYVCIWYTYEMNFYLSGKIEIPPIMTTFWRSVQIYNISRSTHDFSSRILVLIWYTMHDIL